MARCIRLHSSIRSFCTSGDKEQKRIAAEGRVWCGRHEANKEETRPDRSIRLHTAPSGRFA
jgi:hypothetical protein